MPTKRERQVSLTFWLDPEDPAQARTLEVFDHFVKELRRMKKNSGLSLYQLRLQVLMMMSNSLAKAKNPDLFMPQERSDVLLERLVTAMHQMSDELVEVQRKIEQGIPVAVSDLTGAKRAKEIAGEYGAFEESAARQMVSYDIDYEDDDE